MRVSDDSSGRSRLRKVQSRVVSVHKQEIADFIAAWAAEFDEILTEDQAIMEANRFMELDWAIVEPIRVSRR
ncbi:MAG: hypothetical protein JWM95_4002 [Gemmatimonadetes bacterium]|nr:hypothetical protein [Gemmatimonadota bacterium]